MGSKSRPQMTAKRERSTFKTGALAADLCSVMRAGERAKSVGQNECRDFGSGGR